MIRPGKTIKRIVGGFLLLPVVLSTAVHAAGLGKLTVSSALGQPLVAEIELVSLQPGEFESVTARVASPEAYREARIEYASALRQLRFSVDRRANGQPFLKVTSVAPLNEPFLDVLVELNWPAGRLVREYPILLDPPGFNEARPPAAAPQATAAAPTAAPTTAPTTPQVATVTPSKPVDPVKPSVTDTAPGAAAPSAKPAAGKAAPSPSDTYGPVKKGDTLNKIASEMKSDSVSLEQMLVALYRENQAAFIDNNMNLLKTGQILRVPSADEVSKITATDAKKEIRVQVENWKSYRDSVAGAVASSPASVVAPANQASGKIATAKPDAPATGAPAKDVLKLSKADAAPGKAGAAGAKGGPSPQDTINAMREEATAREGALKEAQSRVAALEKQIADMRKVMELKGISATGKPADTKSPAKPDEKKAPEPAKPADTKVAQVTPAAKAPEPAKTPEPVKAEPAKPAEPAKVAEAPKAAEPPKVDAKPADAKPADAKPADAKPAPKPATPAKKAPPPPPEPSLMDTVKEYWVYAAGGLGLLFAGVIGFVFMKKRKAKSYAAGPYTSAASSILPSDLKPPTTGSGKAAGGLIDTGNSSFLTDFDKQGPGTIDTDEVDPVAEAEVYIAYGRDAQAEEILKEAMGRDKSRHEITLKLLEIYHTRKSVQAFETVAREFKDTAGETSPSWARAAAMGAQLDPSNPLYAGFAAQDFGSTAAMAAVAPSADAGKGNPPDLDFDLGFSGTPQQALDVPLDTPSTAPDINLGFDLNLSGPDSAAPTTPAPEPAADAGGGLDFDLGMDKTVAASAPASATAAPKEDGGGFDFDLSSLSLDSADDKTRPASPSATEKTAAINIGEISLDLDSPAPSAAPGGGGDASSTKLELARAYVEIGDKDGAKEILQEVLREGSDAQKQEAQALMSSL